VLSGVFAAWVIFTCYAIIGQTSPLTYAVAGHVKTIVVFLFGMVWMQEVWSRQKTVGVVWPLSESWRTRILPYQSKRRQHHNNNHYQPQPRRAHQ